MRLFVCISFFRLVVYDAVCFSPALHNISYVYGTSICAESAVKHQQTKAD